MTRKDAQLFALQAEICKTLADPTRLMILHELRDGELSVGQLVQALELPQSNVSRHLAVLRDRRIVLTRRDGNMIFYRLASSKIADACDLVRDMLETSLEHSRDLANTLAAINNGLENSSNN